VIRVAEPAEGYGQTEISVRLDADQIADPLDVRMCGPVVATLLAHNLGAVEASVLSDWVVRASTLNSERCRILNERRDTKVVQ
jgi:hypothetical protein